MLQKDPMTRSGMLVSVLDSYTKTRKSRIHIKFNAMRWNQYVLKKHPIYSDASLPSPHNVTSSTYYAAVTNIYEYSK